MNWAAFYRPGFLWGLLFLAGVLLIHLLRRPRARLLEFSTLRFFHDAAVQSSRMRRLRSLLLLLSRLLAAAVIVALFAQPFDKRDRLSLLRDPHCTLFIWVDRTMSMSYTTDGMPLTGRAGALIDSFKKTLPATVRLLCYDEARSEFVSYDKAQPPLLRARYGTAGLNAVLRAWNEARDGYSLPVLLLLSDFQSPTTASLDTLLARAAPKSPVVCVDLAPGDPWNYSLRRALFRDADALSGVSVAVGAQGRPLDSGRVSAMLSALSAGTGRLSVGADDSGEVTIAVSSVLKAPGGSVTLEVNDPLAFDNTAYFTVHSRKSLRVLIVGDREKNFPVAAAFSAAGKHRWDPVVLKAPEEVLFDDLDSAGVIVASDLGGPSRQLDAFLSGRSSREKVMIYAPNASDEGFGESAMFIARAGQLKTPLTLAVRSKPAAVMLPDTISEIWRGFPKLATEEAAVYRYAEGLPGRVLLKLDNRAPLATCFTDAGGRVWILAATPLGVTDANNLCETGFYVPVIDRLARYAAGAISLPSEPWAAGVEYRNPLYHRGKAAVVLNGEGSVIDRWQLQPNVVFRQPGVYTIAPDGEAVYAIPVNSDPEESVLDYRSPSIPEDAKEMVIVLNERLLKEALRGRGRLVSFFPWILLGILLLAEVLLWQSPRRTPEGTEKA